MTISTLLAPSDVSDAQTFMQQFLLALLPDADITQGSAEYDHLVTGFSYIFAYLRQQIGLTQAQQTLLQLASLPPSQDVNEAADAILANLFQSRNQGQYARGPALIHLSARSDITISTTARFFYTRTQYFLVDSQNTFVIPASQLRPVTDSTGAVVEWVGTVPLVASQPGTAYNFPPGQFVNFERFTPFVTYVENVIMFAGGLDVESTSNFVQRASVAVALQALINARSNQSLLISLFPLIQSVVTFGYGDPEMARDLVNDASNGTVLHIGGHVDIVVEMPIQQVVEDLEIGGLFQRPDNAILIFRHDNTVNFATGAGLIGGVPVIPGDYLTIASGLPESPFQFLIAEVEPYELHIDPNTPFSIATDEATGTPPVLVYTIGNNYPTFDNKDSETGSAQTSRTESATNTVMLTGQPVYLVKKVEVLNPPAGFEAYLDPVTNTLLFTQQVNAAPVEVTPGLPLQFQVICANPDLAQSVQAVTQVVIGWPGAVFNGSTLEVTYDSLGSFAAVDAYVSDPLNRPAAANNLTRAPYPIYLSTTIPYSLSSSPSPFSPSAALVNGVLDEDQASINLTGFINTYASTTVMDVALLTSQVLTTEAGLAAVYPFTIDYNLYGPDGRVFEYSTTDRVTVFPDGTHGAVLNNPEDFGLPATNYYQQLTVLLQAFGISDRNITYVAESDDITFELSN